MYESDLIYLVSSISFLTSDKKISEKDNYYLKFIKHIVTMEILFISPSLRLEGILLLRSNEQMKQIYIYIYIYIYIWFIVANIKMLRII